MGGVVMIWLWTALALGSPLPEGVTSGPVARELVKPRSSSVTFSIDGKPEIRDGHLVVRGVLANDSSRVAAVYLVAGGAFALEPRGGKRLVEAEPERSRSPEEWVLPAGARVPFEAELVLEAWELPAEGAEIEWTFQFWDDPVKGKLEGKLAPQP